MTRPHVRLSSADQSLALRTAAQRLADEFEGVFGAETIELFLDLELRPVRRPSATLPNFLPLLAERFARQRLKALAHVEGKATDGVPVVLFLCVHNAGRSQMALGWFQHLAGDRAVAWSGGSEPGTRGQPRRDRRDGRGRHRHHRTSSRSRGPRRSCKAADVVVTMGCGDACPLYPGKRYEDWELDDPAGQDVDAVRPIRDEIGERVRALLASLGVPTA